MRNPLSLFLVVCYLSAFGCSVDKESLEQNTFLVLKGATVIDGSGAPPQHNSVVVIQGKRIISVGQEAGDLTGKVHVMDITGQYILPGFIDTHIHLVPETEVHAQTLQTLVAFGITTIRNPGTMPKAGIELRKKLAGGEIFGPRLFTAGRFIDFVSQGDGGVTVQNETDMRKVVKRQAESGVDFIKLQRRLSPNLVATAIKEAHKHGIKVLGHLLATSWTEAARADIDVLCHSDWFGPIREFIPIETSCEQQFEDIAQQIRCWRENVNLNGSEMDSLISILLDNRIEVNPTLVRTETVWWGDDLSMLEKMEPEYAPAANLSHSWWGENWRERNPYSRNLNAETLAELKTLFPTILEMIRIFHERGVLITAGTDTGNPWLSPGVSFHRELELLVAAGISPDQVLQIATRNGAEALGILDEAGTVTAGKLADLIILTANPLDNIRNTRKIDAVIKAGRWLQPEGLLQ